MRISDWSSDVCSSDLRKQGLRVGRRMIHGRGDEADDARVRRAEPVGARDNRLGYGTLFGGRRRTADALGLAGDRKRVVLGQSVSVRVDLGGRRIIKKTIQLC